MPAALTRVLSLRDLADRPFLTSDLLLWPQALEFPDGTVVAGTGAKYDDPIVERARRQAVSEAVRVVRRGLLPLVERRHRLDPRRLP